MDENFGKLLLIRVVVNNIAIEYLWMCVGAQCAVHELAFHQT